MNRFALFKGMPWLLIVWGFFNMGFPLWKGVEHPLRPVPDSSALFAVGLTAVIAGIIFLELGARLASIERNSASEDSP